jgi:hypothetical protein
LGGLSQMLRLLLLLGSSMLATWLLLLGVG